MASVEVLPYDEFVVVAEEEWKFHSEDRNVPVKFSTRIGNYEWQCSLKNYGITLECLGLNEEMRIEVIVYYGFDSNSYRYYYRYKQARTLLKFKNNQWHYNDSCSYPWICLTIRILKDRSQFLIFTAPNSVGNFVSDVKLRIGKQIYYVNKQLLGWFLPIFGRMFNGDYKESKQEEIELNVEKLANPNVFEDFLLFFCPPSGGQSKVLPNSQNVEDLLVLAEYFQVDLVKKKCERHLELCREMDILERVLLANKFGLKELQAKLVKGCTPEESQRICFALLDAREQWIKNEKH